MVGEYGPSFHLQYGRKNVCKLKPLKVYRKLSFSDYLDCDL